MLEREQEVALHPAVDPAGLAAGVLMVLVYSPVEGLKVELEQLASEDRPLVGNVPCWAVGAEEHLAG